MNLHSPHIRLPFLKVLPVLFLSALAVAFLITIIFLYRNFYLTIAQVETVAELERTVARERLNQKLWSQVSATQTEKLKAYASGSATSTLPTLNRDPFQPL